MRTSFAVVWLSFLSGCGSSGTDDLFTDDGMGGTGTSGAGGSSVSDAGANGGTGANGTQSGGAPASGGSDAGGAAGTSSADASGTGGVTGAGGAAGTGGVIGAGGGAGDGGPPPSGDAGCAFTGCACPAACQCDMNGGHSYAFCTTLETWALASAACASAGARLVRVDDPSENDWVLARASTAGVITAGTNLWLGASDTEMENVWRWEDGEQFWDDTVSSGAGAPVGGLYSNWHGPTPPVRRRRAEQHRTPARPGGLRHDARVGRHVERRVLHEHGRLRLRSVLRGRDARTTGSRNLYMIAITVSHPNTTSTRMSMIP